MHKEIYKQTAFRELKEEHGIEVSKIEKFYGSFKMHFDYENGLIENSLIVLFKIVFNGSFIIQKSEIGV